MRALVTVAGILAFVGVLALATMRGGQVDCEVCVDVSGQIHCAKMRAPDRDEAVAGAQSNVCGTYAGPMDAELQCRNRPPHSVTCTRS